jgi:enamine deaminase RidA (YjgF/YER057c/UK114 family)
MTIAVSDTRSNSEAPMHPCTYLDDLEIRTSRASVTLRRSSGSSADQLYFLCRPADASADAAQQTESVYEAFLEMLAAQGAPATTVVSETLFLRHIAEDLPNVRAACRSVLDHVALENTYRPATTYVGQPPASGARVELAAVAVVPHRRGACATAQTIHSLPCSCAACLRGARAKVLRIDEETHVYAGSICGSARGGFEEVLQMFRTADGLLRRVGMTFRDVVRTWIYLRDIDRDYGDLNRARREFFRQCGIVRKPASTGVQGIPPSDAHDFSMSFYARRSSHRSDIAVMSAPTLNEAWTYGADFSRGLAVGGTETTLYVSGTASIGEAGTTLHVGEFEPQAERMLHNLRALLMAQGATFANLVSAVAYLKHLDDAPVLHRIFFERGFEGFPFTVVEAPLCRPELLCETEAVAVVPAKPEA